MAKEIDMSGWVSIVPDKLIKSWIHNKFIPRTALRSFTETDKREEHGKIVYRYNDPKSMNNKPHYVWVSSTDKKAIQVCIKHGFKKTRSQMFVHTDKYNLMRDTISVWYESVFNYVEAWLKKHGYLNLKQGNIQSGFVTESNANSETAKGWGAPVAAPGNTVAQMKEKFGRITVYFSGCTLKERQKAEVFARRVEKKFDCCTCFV